ncbi:MAG: cytochrome c biogenesis protein ResB [Myxococcales bacterium]|nr:MAG: cytochrome c biogenesis protein ResB [Myxococcales bacterium]
MNSRSRKIIDALWRLFISLKLTFVLLVFISLGAVLGMFFDQTISYEEFYQNHSATGFTSWFLSFFELYDTFHSWWFSCALLLLAANLIACSIERLPRIYFDAIRPRPFLTDRRLSGLKLKAHLQFSSLSEAQARVRSFHKSLKQPIGTINGSEFYFFDSKVVGRFGVYIVHIALLIIMFSSIYATQNGVDGHVLIEEGKKTRFITAKGAGGVSYTHDLGFYIGCNDFRLQTFVDNSPMEYESDLFIDNEDLDRVIQKTVRVNEPLSFQGYTFYQSSFKPIVSEKKVEIEVADQHHYKKRVNLRLGEALSLPNGDKIIPEKIYEDFAGLGQALRLQQKSPDDSATYFHIFRRYPDFDRVVRNDIYFVNFLGADQQYATGLSIGNVPGIALIFGGFVILLLGLYLCFFVSPVRFFARIDAKDSGYQVIVAAQGFRHLTAVEEDYLKRIKTLNKGKQYG